MRTILLSFLFLGFFLALPACKSQKFTADKLPEKYIRWGEGGGFTGRESSNVLLENGQLFSKTPMAENMAELKGIKKRAAQKIFEAAFSPDLQKMEYMRPGNRYAYLELIEGDQVSRISWGDLNDPALEKVKPVFESLQALIGAQQ